LRLVEGNPLRVSRQHSLPAYGERPNPVLDLASPDVQDGHSPFAPYRRGKPHSQGWSVTCSICT